MNFEDIKILAAGAAAWALAIPAVKFAGKGVANGGGGSKAVALVAGVGIAAVTTPLLSYVLKWRTPHERVRGVALALGAAQVIDGLAHIFYPNFYSNDRNEGLASAGNIFLGAGMLGIFSAYQ